MDIKAVEQVLCDKEQLSLVWQSYFTIPLNKDVWAIALEDYSPDVIVSAIKKCARKKASSPEMTVKQMLSYIDSVCHVLTRHSDGTSHSEREEHEPSPAVRDNAKIEFAIRRCLQHVNEGEWVNRSTLYKKAHVERYSNVTFDQTLNSLIRSGDLELLKIGNKMCYREKKDVSPSARRGV